MKVCLAGWSGRAGGSVLNELNRREREAKMRSVQRGVVAVSIKTIILALFFGFVAAGCASSVEKIGAIPLDALRDQQVLAGQYRNEAMILREKAAMMAESAGRYERLFGPQSDWVSGAQQLSHYYASAAQDLDRRAEAYDQAARTKRQQSR